MEEELISTRETVLAEVREAGPLTAKQIAENLGFPQSNVRRALRRLEKEGTVWSDNYQLPARVYGAEEKTP